MTGQTKVAECERETLRYREELGDSVEDRVCLRAMDEPVLHLKVVDLALETDVDYARK